MDLSEEEEEERRREQQQSAARGYVYEPAEPHAEDRPRPPRRPSSVPPQQRSFLDDFSQGRARVHSSRGGGGPRINLSKLQTASLKRYGAAYHLPAAEQAATTREQLLDAVAEHFAAQEVEETEVISCFLQAIKRHRMGLPR
ncbi:hypothetical protein COHA_009524 [Chlorella ohadii]|uniref:Histone deacetylase complex subunit SAP30 Sin3 binding domain-containing protein n=1 Tax=Chlorella ohadii TaxID=2649997 RepID=A0AAD5DLN5_9CHLO|nr:hypothetical protein COHA_009524 [Chlorella ohadii]